MRFGLIIPTLNAGAQFRTLLGQIAAQPLPLRKLIVDSESTDSTVALAGEFGFETLTVPRETFNHGATRQFALERILPVDVAIFLTQDVILRDESALTRLVEIFSADESVGLAYGRQLPRPDATFEARILREFNYPAAAQVRDLSSRKKLGLKAALVSNSFAAYRVSTLEAVGGFPAGVILCEDMYVAAKMLLAGYRVAYAAAAQVIHSHNYTAAQEFRRYFDIGVFHAREAWIRANFGSAEGAGRNFIRLKYGALLRNNPAEIFGAICRDVSKFVGYRLGRAERYLPRFVKECCSMHKNFWRGEFY